MKLLWVLKINKKRYLLKLSLKNLNYYYQTIELNKNGLLYITSIKISF